MMRHLFFLFSAVVVATGAARAQNNVGAQIGTEQDIIRRGEARETEQRIPFRLADPELGEIDIVSRAPRPKMFTFSTDQNLLYTTNAFLLPNNEQDTFFWNGRVNASFVPYATVNFTPRLTFDQNFFRYDEFSTLDFDSSTLTLDLKYDFNRADTWFANLSYTGALLYSPDEDTGEIYRYGLLNGSISHVRQLPGLPVTGVGTLGASWRHGDPGEFDRATIYLNAVLFYSPINMLQVIAFLRPDLQFYLCDPNDSSRTDFNLSGGVGVVWTPKEYISLGATTTFTSNWSSSDPNDYDVFVPSVVLSGRVAF
ncbi:hypothetical protein BH20VER1_BH20VER1_03490 [soil metagenome]